MRIPDTRYVLSGGIAIAYQVHGEGEHDLLLSGSVASNLETVWDLPEAVRLFERLGRFARVIRFDRRDTGVSDPIRDDLALEAHAADALAVMDATGAERPFALGGLDGARSLATVAATHPDRIAGLIALSPTVRGVVDAPDVADVVAASVSAENWPGAMLDLWSASYARDPAGRRRLARYIRTAATPRQAKRLLTMSLSSDVGDVLPLVQSPTLVLHPADAPMPATAVREFAELIEGAVYEETPGDAMLLYGLDVEMLADRIESFVTGTTPRPPSARVLATILFTDLVRSTERAAALGDREWAGLLEHHLTAAGTTIAAHCGETIKSLGDGVLALFAGPAQAVRCAEAMIAESAPLGLEIRSGIHTGEIERRAGDVSGLGVHIAARIMARADAGEILVSRTVRDLVVGSELRFSDRGEHELKGVPGRWVIYAAE